MAIYCCAVVRQITNKKREEAMKELLTTQQNGRTAAAIAAVLENFSLLMACVFFLCALVLSYESGFSGVMNVKGFMAGVMCLAAYLFAGCARDSIAINNNQNGRIS